MSTPPKLFRAALKLCIECGEEFYPAHPMVVVCSMECWRYYKLKCNRKRKGSTKTGPSSRGRTSKYATAEEANEARKHRARDRWRRMKAEDPEGYREYNRAHCRRQYAKHREKILDRYRLKNGRIRTSHAAVKALSELLTLLGENQNG